MIHKVLPLSVYYDRITNFINLSLNIETGIISKSLIEAVREIIREYIIFINQLEIEYQTENLDIQKLWYLTQSSLKILENLQKLCYQSTLVKGGALLNIIYSFLQGTTDLELKKLYKFLLEKSLQKYLIILKQWVCKGLLIDHFQEFMVVLNDNYTMEIMGDYYYDLFWEKKFILNRSNIPLFLNDISEKILFIGKCLNILRECGKVFQCPYESQFDKFLINENKESENLENKIEDFKKKINIPEKNITNFSSPENNMINKNYTESQGKKLSSIFEPDIILEFRNLIDKIYDWANISLKNLLYQEYNIISVLKSIKKFYFMECGDFYNHLIDTSNEILLQEKNKVDFEKIETIIDNAIRSTSAYLDPNKDLFTFALSNMIVRTEKIYLDRYNNILESNEIKILIAKLSELNEDKLFFDFEDSKILESLILEISLVWPMNLIFSKKSLIKYKILFRQLLILKYDEKKLSELWILQQNFKELKLQNYLKPSYLLRDRMINFLKNIIYYFFNEVIEPNYLCFLEDFGKAKSIDEMILRHDKFLDNCLKECLLDDSDILILLNDIIQTCLVYSKVILKYYHSIEDNKNLFNLDLNKMKKMTHLEKRRYRIETENKIMEEIFVEQKFLITVEKFSSSFETRLESFLDRINKL